MKNHLYKPFIMKDNEGNTAVMSIEQQDKYKNRFDLVFSFCGKSYKLHHFGTERDATNVWELLEGISKRKKNERGKKLIEIKTARRAKSKNSIDEEEKENCEVNNENEIKEEEEKEEIIKLDEKELIKPIKKQRYLSVRKVKKEKNNATVTN